MTYPGCVFTMGNPVLDVSCPVSADYLAKYELKPNDAILAEPRHMPIYEELPGMPDTEYFPGGATLNTAKFCQWHLQQTPQAVTYMGCIARDKFGGIMAECCEKNRIRAVWQYNSDNAAAAGGSGGSEPTGVCACLINGGGTNRSLVTHLAAACCFRETHLDVPAHWQCVTAARVCYIAGYFITSCQAALLRVADFCQSQPISSKLFSLNLSAPFLALAFLPQLLEAIERTDLLFANETEAKTLAEKTGFQVKPDAKHAEMAQIAQHLGGLPYKRAGHRRTVVITQGHLEVVVRDPAGDITLYPIPPLSAEQIVDTNGAGDAFVGGYLAELIRGHPIKRCVECGIWTAQTVVQRSGVTVPETAPSFASQK